MNWSTSVYCSVANAPRPYWSEQSIFAFAVITSGAQHLWNSYLSYRQRKVCKDVHQVPAELTDITDQETFSKARLYELDQMTFAFYQEICIMLFKTVVLLSGGICISWKFCEELAVRFGAQNEEQVASCLFLSMRTLLLTLSELPWSVYYTFVIEQRHGFNKQTPGFFAKNVAITFVEDQVLMFSVTYAFFPVLKIGIEYLFVYVWLGCLIASPIVSLIDMEFPLFDKFTQLPDCDLKGKVQSLADTVNFPLKDILVVDRSKRSSHSNAYFCGMVQKKIVLFDTLFEKDREDKNESSIFTTGNNRAQDIKVLNLKNSQSSVGCNDDEILAILAHELGHWKHGHCIKGFILLQIYNFFRFMVAFQLYTDDQVYRAFGFYDSKARHRWAFANLRMHTLPFDTVLSAMMTSVIRHFEFQADFFASRTYHGSPVRRALIKLDRQNLNFPIHDWLHSAWRISHPPVLERIRALSKIE